jgi:SAM-dependent methyltransferase
MYQPDIYDVTWPGTFAGDIDFYRAKARASGGPVLELGAGTGRIAIPIARDGIEVVALDIAAPMLDRLRQKLDAEPPDVRARVTIVQADMRSFSIDRTCAAVFAPFRTFLHNVTADDRTACVARVREHLAPGGRFVFNVFHPSLSLMAHNVGALEGIWRMRGLFPRPDGGSVVRSEADWYDTVRQIVHALIRFEEYAPDGTLTRTALQRMDLGYLYPADIRYLLTQAGFSTIDIAGGFDGRPLQRETDELVVEAFL